MLKFLGIGSAFNTFLGNTSACFRRRDRLLLIDCGGTTFDTILKNKILEGVVHVEIVLTHTHSDHVGSLGDLVFYLYYIRKQRLTIHFPDAERIERLLSLFGVTRDLYEIQSGQSFEWPDGSRFDFLPSNHGVDMPSFGIRGETSDGVWWYSGDSREIQESALEELQAGKLNWMYQDTAGYESPDALHLSLRQLEKSIPACFRNHVFCMHLDETFPIEEALRLGFQIVQRDYKS